MNKRPEERPPGRIAEKGKSVYETKMDRDGRRELKQPRPKKNVRLGSMCLMCGRVFHSDDSNITRCDSCSTPVVDP